MIKSGIGEYHIANNEYDLIVAVSALEHVESEDILEKVIRQMALGTKRGGINCIIVNSEVEEIATDTGEKLDAIMEVNIKTEDMLCKLSDNYNGWKVVHQLVKRLEYNIVREEKDVLLKTNAITFVVRKK